MTQNQDKKQPSNYLIFRSLPHSIQNRILERLSGVRESLKFNTYNRFASLLIISICIVWLGFVFYLTNSYLWGKTQTITIAIISLVALYLLINNVYTFFLNHRSGLKNSILITPYYVFDICSGHIWYWDLDQLVAPDYHHSYQNGSYKNTRISLKLEGDVTKTFEIKGIERAEEIVEQIFDYKKRFAEALVKKDTFYLDSNNDLIELENLSFKHGRDNLFKRNLKFISVGLVSGVLIIPVMFLSVWLNNYYDDKKSWSDAESLGNASSYRKYLQSHPHGRRVYDANQQLRRLYENAGQKYLSSLNEGYDKRAVDAILEVLRYARETQNYRVKIVFERHNEIPENLVEELKDEFEVKNILPLGDTFSEANMNQRESGLFWVVTDAFKEAIPNDILEFSSNCSAECSVFTVKYTINPKDSLYYDSRQKKLPEAERIFYPGILINWNFNIKTPNQLHSYDFDLESRPAKEITYDTNSDNENSDKENMAKVLDADKKYIYDSMVASAFNDFKQNLVYRMGIGREPKKNNDDEKHKENTSDVGPTN